VLRRIDPLGPLFAVLGLGVFLINGYGGVLTRDLSLYAYSGQQFADGVAPYVSVMNRAGPLAHVVPGIGAIIAGWLGTDDVLTQRVVMTVLSMITVWLVYVIGRDMFRSRSAGAIAATTLLTIQGFMLYATGGPREKTTMVLMVTLAVWAILHRRWGWAGAFISLATLTWQPAFFFGIVMAVAAMSFTRRDLVRSLARVCVGGAIPAVVTMVGFAVWGAFGALVDGFLLINARYTDQTGIIGFVQGEPSSMYDGFGPSLWVLLLGLVLAVVNAVALWRRAEDRQSPEIRAQIAIGVGVVFSLLWSFKAFNGWADAMFVVPVAVLGFTAGVHWLVQRLPRSPAVATAYCALALVLAGINAGYQSVAALPAQRVVVHDVFEIAGSDATVASVGGPMPLVLAHKTNPVKYQMFLNGFDDYVDDTYPGGLAGLADTLDSYQPTFITMDYPQFYDWIRPLIDREYVEIGTSADLTWFARTDLGQDKIDQLKQVVADHPIPARP
jgi:hypothetical protein